MGKAVAARRSRPAVPGGRELVPGVLPRRWAADDGKGLVSVVKKIAGAVTGGIDEDHRTVAAY
jgi:hypothetical protein